MVSFIPGKDVIERKLKVASDIRHRQEHIEFLENYITELTKKIDGLTEGRNIEKMIRSLEYRIEMLKKCDGQFSGRLTELKSELNSLKNEYEKLKPILEQLEKERAFYRCNQLEL